MLISILNSNIYDIIIFTETWLNKNIFNSLLNLNDTYTLYRLDRNTNTHGSGILVYVNMHYNTYQINMPNNAFELICINVLHFRLCFLHTAINELRTYNIKSTDLQLLKCYRDIFKAKVNSKSSDIIYIDMAKAFDKVSHKLLLYKLFNIVIQGDVLKWITSYLFNRIQSVKIDNNMYKP